MAIQRTPMVDDDGSGTTGTVINNAWKTELYNQIDAALSAAAVPAAGAWTPTDASGAGLTFGFAVGDYIKAGPLVVATGEVTFPVTSNSAPFKLGGLPFPSAAPGHNGYSAAVGFINLQATATVYCPAGTTNVIAYRTTGAVLTNAEMSGLSIRFTLSYRT